MKIDRMVGYGIPEKMIPIWKRSGLESLLKIQERALTSEALFNGNLLILAPTSSGKTFCGEIAALKAAAAGQRAVFLVPLKAIAVEKAEDLGKKYSPSGIRVLLSTSSERDFDNDILKGDFEIAVIIYEKFNRFLTGNINLLSAIEVVIMDEIDMLHDPERGGIVRSILAKITTSVSKCRLIGLGREDFDPTDIPILSGAQVLRDNYRPVELHKGILLDGDFEYKHFNGGSVASEALNGSDSIDIESSLNPSLSRTLKYIESRGEQAIVFLKSRPSAVGAALAYSQLSELPSSQSVISRLSDLEPTTSLNALLGCLQAGIGFHNSDLTESEGKAIVDGFRTGDIRILFSTTTLCSGVNLPAKNVFIEPVVFAGENSDLRPMEVLMDFKSVDTIAGRAGRLGKDHDFGRAVILAGSEFEKEVLWNKYIEGARNRTTAVDFTEEIIVDLVTTGLCSNRTELYGIAGSAGFAGLNSLENRIEKLVQSGFFKRENDTLTATSLARSCALTGLKADTVIRITERFIEDQPHPDIPSMVGLLVPCREISDLRMPSYFYYQCRKGRFMGDDDDTGRQWTINDAKALYLSGLLSEWADGIDQFSLENKFHISAGAVADIAERFGWLIHSAADVLRSMGTTCPIADLRSMADSIKYGLPSNGIELAKLNLFGLGRSRIMALLDNGFEDTESIARTSPEKLPDVIPDPVKKNLISACKAAMERRSKHGRAGGEQDAGQTLPIKKLKLGPPKNRGRIKIILNGMPGFITYKSYQYLRKLASALIEGAGGGWVHRLDLDSGDNQWTYLHRLRKELEEMTPAKCDLIENDRNGHYRLKALPEGIRIEEED